MILDKPGKLTVEEMTELRRHPDYSLRILEQVEAFQTLADISGAHHERLDGQGYHRRLGADALPWAARVLTVADIYEAMSAKRPYRDAMPWEKIYDVMSNESGLGIDPDCFRALVRWHERSELKSRVDDQLREVERLTETW